MSNFTPFTELNEQIHGRLEILLPALETDSFNGLKLVQHALSYVYSGHSNKLFPNRLHWPFPLLKAYYTFRGIRHKIPARPHLNAVVFKDSGRMALNKNEEPVSIYFSNFLGLLAKKSYSHLLAEEAPLDAPGQIHLRQLSSLRQRPLEPAEIKVLRDIIRLVDQLRRAGMATSELQYVSSVCHVFFEDFHFYYQLLSGQKVQRLVLTCHYHQEGLIAAAKLLGIEVVEAQHGLIATSDLYYVYPDFVEKISADCLFADKVLLYGNYWQKLLLQGAEYHKNQLHVVGDYVYKKQAISELKDIPKEDAIFIGSQKNLADEYLGYIRHLHKTLRTSNTAWKIIVKTHPLEKEVAKYQELAALEGVEIHGNEADLSRLLARVRIQISVYSTTFFDALGLGVVNMSLQGYTPFADYAEEMVREGIALPLQFDDNPVEQLKKREKSVLTRDQVYAPLNKQLIQELLQPSEKAAR